MLSTNLFSNSIKDIFEFMEAMDPSENPDHAKLLQRLGLSNQQLAQAAKFTNTNYPNLDLEFSLQNPESITANAPAYLNIRIERDIDDDDEDNNEGDTKMQADGTLPSASKKEPDTTVHAPFYPARKLENWWLVIGDQKAGTLLAIKRITVSRKLELKLEFAVQTAGKHELRLYLMSDSYVGVDQDPAFTVVAAEGEESEEEESEEDGDGGEGEEQGGGEREGEEEGDVEMEE